MYAHKPLKFEDSFMMSLLSCLDIPLLFLEVMLLSSHTHSGEEIGDGEGLGEGVGSIAPPSATVTGGTRNNTNKYLLP